MLTAEFMTELLIDNSPKPDIPYSPLSTVVLSGLLERDGEADIDGLKNKLETEAGITQPIMPFIKNALLKHGLVDLRDSILTATEAGIDYAVQRTDYIDRPPRKRRQFSATKYRVFSHFQEEAGPDGGWLYEPSDEPVSAYQRVADQLGMSYANLTRRVADYEKAHYIKKRVESNGGRNGGPSVTNFLLYQHGEAELEEMRIHFPGKIADLTEAAMDDQVEPGRQARDYLLGTFILVSDEINNMLVELGEEPKDFTRFEDLPEEEMGMALSRLRLVAKKLEWRVDKANNHVLTTV
jgi:hypothetical protein